MPITFACACGTSITVPDKLAGKQGKCKKCGALIVAPAPKGAPKAAPKAAGKASPAVLASGDATLSEANVSETNVDTDEADESAKGQGGLKTGVVKFKCPGCKTELKVPLHLAGKSGKCRKCQASFVSPVPEALKQARAKIAAQAGKVSLRDAFSVVKARCSCGVTSAVLKGKAASGEERCPACNKPLTVTA